MAGLSFVDVDLGKAAPLAVLAAIGFGLWYVWQRTLAQQQANAAATAASPLAAYQAAADLSLLQAFTGGTGAATTATTSTSTANPALPTYSAPANPTANATQPATASQSVATASATSNGI